MVINFFGMRGCGKTTAIKGNIQDCRSPVIIIDLLGNYHHYGIQCNNIDEAIEELKKYYLLPENKKKQFLTGYCINLKTADPERAADYISACIWEMKGGTLVFDEIDSVSIKEGSCFDQYIRYGRNHSGDLITGCRRPAELSKNITAAANQFYCFQTHEWRDIEYFHSIFGEKAEKLMRLPKYHGLFIHYDREIEGVFKTDEVGKIYYLKSEPLNSSDNLNLPT